MQFVEHLAGDVAEIFPQRHGDDRGHFSETFRADWFQENIENVSFVQDNESLSAAAGTIRGIHFQTVPAAQGKLVRCAQGRILDIAVDLRQASPSFRHWVAVELSADAGNQLWIPPGFGHAFCTLVPNTIVSYKVTAYYSPEHDAGIRWDDPDIGIEWPSLANPETLSAKDRGQPLLSDITPPFAMEI